MDPLQSAGGAHPHRFVTGTGVSAFDLDVVEGPVAVVDDFDFEFAEAEHAVGEVGAEVAWLVFGGGGFVGEVDGVGEGGGDDADDAG